MLDDAVERPRGHPEMGVCRMHVASGVDLGPAQRGRHERAQVALLARHVDAVEVVGERRIAEDPDVEIVDGGRNRGRAADLLVDGRHANADARRAPSFPPGGGPQARSAASTQRLSALRPAAVSSPSARIQSRTRSSRTRPSASLGPGPSPRSASVLVPGSTFQRPGSSAASARPWSVVRFADLAQVTFRALALLGGLPEVVALVHVEPRLRSPADTRRPMLRCLSTRFRSTARSRPDRPDLASCVSGDPSGRRHG